MAGQALSVAQGLFVWAITASFCARSLGRGWLAYALA
jgi:hypothetical protein